MADMVRVNTRISRALNDWLDKQSKETGVPKSTLIMLALENFYREKEVLSKMSDMGYLIQKLEEIEKKINS